MSKITRLGLSIVAFDGTEHLKNILYELRGLCDVIHVCLQRKSYHGDPIAAEDVDEVELLSRLGFVDRIIWYDPDLSYLSGKFDMSVPRRLECAKRNMMLDELEKEGCSHSIITDSDEFYDYDEFKKAKDLIDGLDYIRVTYCQYVNYYNAYDRILLYPWPAYVPFITESSYRFEFDSGDFDRPSDPTRRYKLEPGPDGKKNFQIIDWDTVHMHHLSWIRRDIEKKLDCWSAKRYFENVAGLRGRILDRYYNWTQGENAYLMFGVPDNQVIVQRLDDQYINPRWSLTESPEKLEYRK